MSIIPSSRGSDATDDFGCVKRCELLTVEPICLLKNVD